MEEGILTSTKKNLGIAEEYHVFDDDIIGHINSAFSVLQQIGVGPDEGYFIEGDTENWVDYLYNDAGLNMVRSYVFLKVKMLFDPPVMSFHIQAMKDQIEEFEVRISNHREWMLDPNDPRLTA